MKIFVLSDTHIPRTTGDIPAKLYNEIKKCDMIFHAGDFVDKEFFDKLSALKPTYAVYGNMDSNELKKCLNQKEIIEVGKFKIALIHGWGAPDAVRENIRKELGDVNAIVFGHTHAPINEVKDGILFFNPGSPTDRTFAPYNSYGILEVSDEKIEGKIVKI